MAFLSSNQQHLNIESNGFVAKNYLVFKSCMNASNAQQNIQQTVKTLGLLT